VFAPGAGPSGRTIDVAADEAAHLLRVLRLGTGAQVRVFDGAGGEWTGAIVAASKTHVTIALEADALPAPEPRIAYTMALAVLKGDATDEAVRDAVMLGVTAIQPFVCARSEVSAGVLQRAHRRERWERVAVASAKQCGRAVVPVVHDTVTFDTLVRARSDACRLLLVEPAVGGAVKTPAEVPPPVAAVLAAGPEGGWTADEVATAVAAGWQPVRLGARILRAVSAPVVALAACQAVWRDD